jgi:hypothetical protein
MLDPGAIPMSAPARAPVVQQLPPVSVPRRKKQSTWGRWVGGPSLMSVTAVGVWLLAGWLLPPAVIKPIEQPPPKARPMSHIQLKTTPPGAQVKLDETVLNHFTPTTLEGPVGVTEHLTLTLAGYKPHEEDVLFAEQERPLVIVLDKLDETPFELRKHPVVVKKNDTPPPPKQPGHGTISIFVHPWAVVFMDGVRLRQTPIANLEVPTGSHEFQMVNETLKKSETVNVTIKPGPNPEIRLEFEK